ncbi:uncharacterized protein LOC121748700 isoform X1 [Salvia splendens]|uniref:uncharacterized protein LOC121748700 isoform X1 n=2 Tax=Salvia splendens TaxID=180675 RepID=UPI001C25F2AB|nr:uncharacterized protein LOC121748700 isoform X1 [Salvia splendens]
MFRYMMLHSSFSSWISHFLACMGSCIGCCDKSHPITAVDEPSKGLRIQGQLVKKHNMSDDFWSTSTCDLLENSALQSQRSYSSISVSNQSVSCSGSASNPPEFINHGLLLWNQSRAQWVGTKKSQTPKKNREPVLSWNASYENLLGTSKRFPQPVPLSEMVDFLVDIWDQEGLYDC